MTGKELWNAFIKNKNMDDCEYDAWAFGEKADLLARLVADGEKTAISSAYPLYELENEALPTKGEYSVILDSKGNAVCVIRTTKVFVCPFCEITEEFACKEGEGDKSLAYWKAVHESFFADAMKSAGLTFSDDMKVVCEEFEVVYQ